MVPVSVRGEDEADAFGNRISFMFIELPCDEPDPERRLRRIHMETSDAKEGGDPSLSETALKLAASAPRTVQRAGLAGDGEPADVQPGRLQHPRPERADVHGRLRAEGGLPGGAPRARATPSRSG